MTFGQPLGGFLFDLGRAVPFLADALSYAVSFVAVGLIRTPFGGTREGRRQRVWREIGEGIGWLWRQPFLRAAALLVAGSNFLFQALVLVIVVVARERGASATAIGLMLAGLGVGGLLGSLAAPYVQRRLSGAVIVIGANWLWALLVAPIAFVESPLALGALLAAAAFVGPAWNVVVGTYQLAMTPEALLGRVSSVTTLLAWGTIPLGSLAAGLLLEALDSVTATLVLASWQLLVALIATVAPDIRRTPAL